MANGNGSLTEKTSVKVSLGVVVAVAWSLLAGALAAERNARQEAFKHYISREEWADRWGKESERRDRQFYQLRELILEIRREKR